MTSLRFSIRDCRCSLHELLKQKWCPLRCMSVCNHSGARTRQRWDGNLFPQNLLGIALQGQLISFMRSNSTVPSSFHDFGLLVSLSMFTLFFFLFFTASILYSVSAGMANEKRTNVWWRNETFVDQIRLTSFGILS